MQVISNAGGSWEVDDGIIPDWLEEQDWSAGAALKLACDAELQATFAEASAIAIEFPAFNDGRALSLAVLLRTRLGYSGPLWAVGDIHEDIAHYMVRCGFTHLVLGRNKPANEVLAMLNPYRAHYQSCLTEPEPAFRRVQRGTAG